MTKYIIDANILIQAHRKYYTLDVFVSFWMNIKRLADSGILVSIDKVRDEIISQKDALTQWCINQLPKNFFIDSSPFIREYSGVIKRVAGLNKFMPNAISEFSNAKISDAFLVATVLSPTNNYVLVTEEVSDPNCKRKVKIPDVCSLYGLKCINTIDMLKALNITI